jgi:hypothetical protein
MEDGSVVTSVVISNPLPGDIKRVPSEAKEV